MESKTQKSPKWNRALWKYHGYRKEHLEAAQTVLAKAYEYPCFRSWYDQIEERIHHSTPAGEGIALYFQDAGLALDLLIRLGWEEDFESSARAVGRQMYVKACSVVQVLLAEGAMVVSLRDNPL